MSLEEKKKPNKSHLHKEQALKKTEMHWIYNVDLLTINNGLYYKQYFGQSIAILKEKKIQGILNYSATYCALCELYHEISTDNCSRGYFSGEHSSEYINDCPLCPLTICGHNCNVTGSPWMQFNDYILKHSTIDHNTIAYSQKMLDAIKHTIRCTLAQPSSL